MNGSILVTESSGRQNTIQNELRSPHFDIINLWGFISIVVSPLSLLITAALYCEEILADSLQSPTIFIIIQDDVVDSLTKIHKRWPWWRAKERFLGTWGTWDVGTSFGRWTDDIHITERHLHRSLIALPRMKNQNFGHLSPICLAQENNVVMRLFIPRPARHILHHMYTSHPVKATGPSPTFTRYRHFYYSSERFTSFNGCNCGWILWPQPPHRNCCYANVIKAPDNG